MDARAFFEKMIKEIYCREHKDFKAIKGVAYKFDFDLNFVKLVAILECGCEVWVATSEKEAEV